MTLNGLLYNDGVLITVNNRIGGHYNLSGDWFKLHETTTINKSYRVKVQCIFFYIPLAVLNELL